MRNAKEKSRNTGTRNAKAHRQEHAPISGGRCLFIAYAGSRLIRAGSRVLSARSIRAEYIIRSCEKVLIF